MFFVYTSLSKAESSDVDYQNTILDLETAVDYATQVVQELSLDHICQKTYISGNTWIWNTITFESLSIPKPELMANKNCFYYVVSLGPLENITKPLHGKWTNIKRIDLLRTRKNIRESINKILSTDPILFLRSQWIS